MPSLTTILVGLLLVIAAAVGGDHFGYGRGVASQKVADQVQFDKINKDLTEQKAQANTKYRLLSEQVIANAQSADNFKHQLEVTREKARTDLATLRSQYDTHGLWFTTTKSAGCGASSGGPQGSQGLGSGLDATVQVELPPTLRSALRKLMDEADEQQVNYQACYDWVNRPAQ